MSTPTIELEVNGKPRVVAEGATVAALLAELALAPPLVAVEVNRTLVPRAAHADRRLSGGDRVEIVTLVGGG